MMDSRDRTSSYLRRIRIWLTIFVAGLIRGIPFAWRLADSSFGIFGSIPLLICRRSIRALEAMEMRTGNQLEDGGSARSAISTGMPSMMG